LFYQATRPSCLHEAMSFVAFSICKAVLPVGKGRYGLYYQTHEAAHGSRFYFTLLHGPHHDAIPSGLIGSTGTGFLASVERRILWGCPIESILLSQLEMMILNLRSMVSHQYIPGIFPYNHFSRNKSCHHVVHHYGSLRPLGQFRGVAFLGEPTRAQGD